MVAVRKIQEEAARNAAVPSAPAGDLGKVLVARSNLIASWWRRRYYGDETNSLPSTGQIEGLLETLIVEIGRSIQAATDLPLSAWAKTQGILRLSIGSGPEGLNYEFDLLRTALEQVAEQLRALPSQRRRMRVVLDACQASALARLRQARGISTPLGLVPFGGVVTETV
jgi:hypothetical protein